MSMMTKKNIIFQNIRIRSNYSRELLDASLQFAIADCHKHRVAAALAPASGRYTMCVFIRLFLNSALTVTRIALLIMFLFAFTCLVILRWIARAVAALVVTLVVFILAFTGAVVMVVWELLVDVFWRARPYIVRIGLQFIVIDIHTFVEPY